MIKRKEKICKNCNLPKLIFAKNLCSYCWNVLNSKPIKSNSVIKKQSESYKERNEKYKLLKELYIKEHPTCEYENCNKPGEEIHHKEGRKGDKLFCSFMHICREHHMFIHNNVKESKEKGYLL